jgi:hypothetical protein
MLRIILCLAFMLVPQTIKDAKNKQCDLGMVDWVDATLYGKDTLKDPDIMVTPVRTFGCICQSEHTIVVIFNMTNGEPNSFMVIPKEWAITVTIK